MSKCTLGDMRALEANGLWNGGLGWKSPVRRVVGLILVEILFDVVLLNYREM